MSRSRIILDAEVFLTIRRLLATGGEKSVAFAAVARATGLAAPTLVQRFGAQAAMVQAALAAGWDGLDAALAAADAAAPPGAKGAQALLKSLYPPDITLLATSLRDTGLRARSATWRDAVEAALAARLGKGDAAILFAAWQGQALWHAAGEKRFRLRDAVKRLG